MFEGVPNWPDLSWFWRIVDKHQVEIFLRRSNSAPLPDAFRRQLGDNNVPQPLNCSAQSASRSIPKNPYPGPEPSFPQRGESTRAEHDSGGACRTGRVFERDHGSVL